MACYLIRAGDTDRVKIGFAVDVGARIRTLQSGCWERLILLRTWHGGRTVEAWLHRRFAHLRIAREWFRFDGDMLTESAPRAEKSDVPTMDVQTLIDKAGGVGKLAALLGVSHPTVCDWKRTGFIPGGRLVQISKKLSVEVEDLSVLIKSASTEGLIG